MERVLGARQTDRAFPQLMQRSGNFTTVHFRAATIRMAAPLHVGSRPTTSVRRWTVTFTPTTGLSERGINVNSIRDRLKDMVKFSRRLRLSRDKERSPFSSSSNPLSI
jgi:hypothetical protein